MREAMPKSVRIRKETLPCCRLWKTHQLEKRAFALGENAGCCTLQTLRAEAKIAEAPDELGKQAGEALPCGRRQGISPEGFRSRRHGKTALQGACPGTFGERHCSDVRTAGQALRPGSLGLTSHLPGHGRRRKGRSHKARDVRREPARLPSLFFQDSLF